MQTIETAQDTARPQRPEAGVIGRIWFVCPLEFGAPLFLRFRRDILEHLSRHPVLSQASCHFALVDATGGEDKVFDELHNFTNTVLLRTAGRMHADNAIVFGLRLLRGTIREEDVVIAVDPRNLSKNAWLDALLRPLLEEGYDSKKLVLLDEGWSRLVWAQSSRAPTVGFRGWFAQFQLKRSEFNQGFRLGIHDIDLPKRSIRLPGSSFGAWMNSLGQRLARVTSSGIVALSLPFVILCWTAVALYLLITPSYAAFWSWLN